MSIVLDKLTHFFLLIDFLLFVLFVCFFHLQILLKSNISFVATYFGFLKYLKQLISYVHEIEENLVDSLSRTSPAVTIS